MNVTVEQKYLSIYDEASGWKLVPGGYAIMVGGSSAELPLTQRIELR